MRVSAREGFAYRSVRLSLLGNAVIGIRLNPIRIFFLSCKSLSSFKYCPFTTLAFNETHLYL